MRFTRITITLITLLSVLVHVRTYAQDTSTSDCRNAISVCQNIYVETVSPTSSGSVVDLDAGNQDCLLNGEHYCTWYVINVVQSGDLVFTITNANAASNDYDFAVYNITGTNCTPSSCELIIGKPPVRCNYDGTALSTGLAYTPGPYFEAALPVLKGETYVIIVDNFSTSTIGYTIDFNGSTASIFDQDPPGFTSVGSRCDFGSSMINVKLTEPVLCDSIAADGSDFILTSASGQIPILSAYSTACQVGSKFAGTISLQLASVLTPGSYTLQSKMGNDKNTLEDLCGNKQTVGTSITFNVNENPNPLFVAESMGSFCLTGTLIFSKGIKYDHIALDGSDFLLKGPDTNARIIRATPRAKYTQALECSSVDLTDTVDVQFNKSLFYPGVYTIESKMGTDGDPILDTCDAALGIPFEFTVSDQDGVDATSTTPVLCAPNYVYINSRPLLPAAPHGYMFTWSPSAFVLDTTAANTIAYVEKTTVYKVQILDSGSCYRRDTVRIIVSERKPMIEPLTDTSICIGDTFRIDLSGGVEYLWTPREGLDCYFCPSVVVGPEQTTTYTIKISDQYGCYDELKLFVEVNPLPYIQASADTSVVYGERVPLYVYSPGGVLYYWTPVFGLSAPNSPMTYASPEVGTNYIVTVADTNGCRAMDTVMVLMKDKYVQIPSAFSPNGDGKNDVFRIANMTYEGIQEFRVYNRWGQVVYNETNGKPKGWDGTYNGKPADIGVYTYVIRVGLPDGRTEKFTGDVTLVR